MEMKCDFCEFFGEKKHCNNCRVFNRTRKHAPQEIDMPLEEFVNYINDNMNAVYYFSVGDYKYIELYTGEKVKLVILDIDKDKLADESGNAKLTLGILSVDGYYKMNRFNTNETSWKNSEMRTKTIEGFYRLLPDCIRNNVKPVVKRTSAGGGSEEIILTTDKCFLFSESEVFGDIKHSLPGENEQYEYFANATAPCLSSLWLRSPLSGYSRQFCFVSDGGHVSYMDAGCSYGVAFGFCI